MVHIKLFAVRNTDKHKCTIMAASHLDIWSSSTTAKRWMIVIISVTGDATLLPFCTDVANQPTTNQYSVS